MMEQIIHRFFNSEVRTIFSSLTIFHLTSTGVQLLTTYLLLDCVVESAVLCYVWCGCGL